ncbi:MAG: cysteine peptidase family C39 domain-containing protein [Isosphaeraceae bacterium]
MHLLLAMLLVCFEQGDSRSGGVKLSDDYIKIDKARINTRLRVADGYAKIEAMDIWQTGPYCGLNCLYVILRLHGRQISYDKLKNEVRTTLDGATLLELKTAGTRYGLEMSVLKVSPQGMDRVEHPVIALLGDGDGPDVKGHFVVVYNNTEDTVEVIDGTTGNLNRISKGLFNRAFSGYVLAKPDQGPLDIQGYNRADQWLAIGCGAVFVLIVLLSLRVR